MPVLTHIAQLATCSLGDGQADVGLIPDAVLAWEHDTIRWAGPAHELPDAFSDWEAWDAGERLVIPGLIDAHTHLAFGGWRADEFAARIEGASYLDIARQGGGIASTVNRTRALDEEALLARARGFVAEIARLGVTAVECKSGYGLTVEDELKLLNVYRRLAEEGPLRIVPTFLGAHVVPAEYREDRAGYMRSLIDDMLPSIAERDLARFCDVFVEDSAFTLEEARELLVAAAALGLGAKVHADQLTDGGGARLAADLDAVSAEHLEHVSGAGIVAMADAGVVAVTLPIATLYLNQDPPPARALIDAGVAVVVATDFNPGTAPSFHLPFAMTLACTRQRMTPAEVLKGATLYAARAIGLEDRCGSLEAGKAADFSVIDAPDVDTWLYHLRPNACTMTVVGGEIVWGAPGADST
jgi:imidazolonepropionase